MRAHHWLLAIAFLSHAPSVLPQASESGAKNGSGDVAIGISWNAADSSPRRIGDTLGCRLSISYHNAPSGSSVFLVLHPLKDDELLTPEGMTVQSSGVDMDLVASLETQSDGGVFKIDSANYPEALLIPASSLETLAGQMWGKELAKSISAGFGPHGMRLVLGFLASLGRGGEGREQAFFSFTLPKLEHAYDGVLITPMLLTYEPDGRQKIAFHSGRMPSLKIRVTSD